MHRISLVVGKSMRRPPQSRAHEAPGTAAQGGSSQEAHVPHVKLRWGLGPPTVAFVVAWVMVLSGAAVADTNDRSRAPRASTTTTSSKVTTTTTVPPKATTTTHHVTTTTVAPPATSAPTTTVPGTTTLPTSTTNPTTTTTIMLIPPISHSTTVPTAPPKPPDDPITEPAASPSTTAVEVLGVQVTADELPFTGIGSAHLALLAAASVLGGAMLLSWTGRHRPD